MVLKGDRPDEMLVVYDWIGYMIIFFIRGRIGEFASAMITNRHPGVWAA